MSKPEMLSRDGVLAIRNSERDVEPLWFQTDALITLVLALHDALVTVERARQETLSALGMPTADDCSCAAHEGHPELPPCLDCEADAKLATLREKGWSNDK